MRMQLDTAFSLYLNLLYDFKDVFNEIKIMILTLFDNI